VISLEEEGIRKGLAAEYYPEIRGRLLYASFGLITKFTIQSPTFVSVSTYKIEKTIVVKMVDSKKIEMIIILFIFPSFKL